MNVAVVGSGIAGLAAAWRLQGRVEVTLFEADERFGGHAHTVDLTLPDAQGRPVTHGVDTGFLVYNERTYPQLVQLFAELGVPTSASDMSFSVQVPGAFGNGALEWSGTSLRTVFCQPANALRPGFWRMLADLVRFNGLATRLARTGDLAGLAEPLGSFLDRHRFSREFREWYLLPMLGCIWSCPTGRMLAFPVATLVRFCHNHGLLQLTDRPQWRTVTGGSRQYVQRIVHRIADRRAATPVLSVVRTPQGILLRTRRGTERFDRLVLATHPDQALALLHDADDDERGVLGAIRYQANRAVLHSDASVLPRDPRAWSAWNYEAGGVAADEPRVCLHYLLNRLQPLPWKRPIVVSLNPVRPIASRHVLGEFAYAHPVFDLAALDAQERLPAIQGRRHTWFCGAWTGYGFHEDGLRSGLEAARDVRFSDTARDDDREAQPALA